MTRKFYIYRRRRTRTRHICNLSIVNFPSVISITITCICKSIGDAGMTAYISPLKMRNIAMEMGNRTKAAVSFASFSLRYGKSSSTMEKTKKRFSIFTENTAKIIAHNQKSLSYTLVKEFADLTKEEFSKQRLGEPQKCSAATTESANPKAAVPNIPDKIDWRESGIISQVQNQGSCGSCWAFSATGAMEAAYALFTGQKVLVSEQQLVDCADGFNNLGCLGGLPSQALEYFRYNGGIATEEAYPYTGRDDGPCAYEPKKIGLKMEKVFNITRGDEEELQFAVALQGPVSVAFDATEDLLFYKGGVYSSEICGAAEMDVNHAVLAVGYGVEDEISYWLMKNSWGADWGDNGYFEIELGKNMVLRFAHHTRLLLDRVSAMDGSCPSRKNNK